MHHGMRPQMGSCASELWERVEALWTAALERPASQRVAWLEAQCGDDAALRRDVQELLDANVAVGDRFERLMGRAMLDGPPTDGAMDPDGNEHVLLTGRVFGYVRVDACLGQGGMGRVYRGVDTRLGRRVALKVLRPELATRPSMVQRLAREARLLSRLGHPGICTLYDVIEMPGTAGLVLELVPGRPLSAVLADGVERRQALRWVRDLAQALATAHRLGVVHRDLKPSNVLCAEDGSLKILDFGIAQEHREAESPALSGGDTTAPSDLTATGARLGTCRYLSREQAQGEPLTPATDVFSLGLVLYELLTGQTAYCPERLGAEWFDAVLYGRVPALPVKDDDIAGLLAHMTHGEPASRPSAWQVAERLEVLLQQPRRRRARRLRLAGLGVLACFAGIVSWQAWRVSEEAERANAALAQARNAAVQAHQEAVTAEQVTDLLVGVFHATDPWGEIPAEASEDPVQRAEDVLRRSLRQLDDGLAEDPLVRARLLHAVAKVAINLEMLDVAGASAKESLELRQGHLVQGHADIIESLALWAQALFYQSRWAESFDAAQQAVSLLDRSQTVSPDLELAAFISLNDVALQLGELKVAESASRRCLAVSSRQWGEDSAQAWEARGMLAVGLFLKGKRDQVPSALQEAKVLFEAAAAHEQERLGPQHPLLAMTLYYLAQIAIEEGEPVAAEAMLRRGIDILSRRLGDDALQAEHLRTILGTALWQQGRLQEADGLYRQLVERVEKAVGMQAADLRPPLREWARVRLLLGNRVGAEDLARRALRIAEATLPLGHWGRGDLEVLLAEVLWAQGRTHEAGSLLRNTLAHNEGSPGGSVAQQARWLLRQVLQHPEHLETPSIEGASWTEE